MNKMLYCLKRNSLQCAAVLILVCVVTGCVRSDNEDIPVCNVVKEIFQKEDIHNCSVTLLGRYDDFFGLAYEEGKRLIETYLIIGAVYYDEFGDFEYGTDEDIYYQYQMIENDVYSLFINADENF